MMNKILLALLFIPTLAGAAQQEITIVPDDPTIPSIGSLKDAINLRLADIDENFDEIYPILTAGSGDNLGSAVYSDIVALWTTCTGYLKSDGTCDTPSGSATYPSAAGVANWNGSAWGSSYTLDTDLSTVSASDDTIPSAKATKALVDGLPTLAAGTGITITENGGGAGIDTINVTTNTYQAYDADLTTWAGIAPGSGVGTFLATPSSANLASAVTGETGSGALVFDTSPVFSTSVALPQGAGPTVDAAGEIAVDTTSDQLIYYGGAKRVITYKKQIDFAVKTPVDADDFLLFKAQTAMTITDIHVIAQGGTSISVDIQECDSAGANCATVDAAITADTDGAEDDGTLSNGAIDAGDWVKVVLGAPSGTVNFLAGSIYYVEAAD